MLIIVFQFVPVYFADSTFFTKMGINMMMRSLNSHPFQTSSIQSYLWNSTDRILDVSQSIAPNIVSTKNTGILHTVSIHLNTYTNRLITSELV